MTALGECVQAHVHVVKMRFQAQGQVPGRGKGETAIAPSLGTSHGCRDSLGTAHSHVWSLQATVWAGRAERPTGP